MSDSEDDFDNIDNIVLDRDTDEDIDEIDENKTPNIRYLMNLFIFVTLCGSVYLLFLYIKEAKENNAAKIPKPKLNVANAEISTTTQTD